jgi:hypothetical protein
MPSRKEFANAQQTAVAGTGAVAIVPASGTANVFRDLAGLIISTVNTAIAALTISDGSKAVMVLNYPNVVATAQFAPFVALFDPPIQQSGNGNAAWTLTASVNGVSFNVTAQWIER